MNNTKKIIKILLKFILITIINYLSLYNEKISPIKHFYLFRILSLNNSFLKRLINIYYFILIIRKQNTMHHLHTSFRSKTISITVLNTFLQKKITQL